MYNIIILAAIFPLSVAAGYFSKQLCKNHDFDCYKVTKNDTWESLIPNEEQRLMVMKINRTNTKLKYHKYIAIPKSMFWKDLHDFSPMPYNIDSVGNKTLVISIEDHAYGAYDESGELIKWGPISAGKGYCPDTKSYCRTVRGDFSVYRKGGVNCKSGKYPLATGGGAPMPYCMFFHKGFAMHGSTLPGNHASHGCVRMFTEDAQWLHGNFIDYGTKVSVVNDI